MNLEEEVKILREENKYLKETIVALTKRIEELEGRIKEKNKPSFVKEEVKQYYHKSGQKKGHEGHGRETPEEIDEIIKLNPDKCPDCGGELSGIQDVRERVVTDIEIKKINRKYIIYRKYCKTEGKIVELPVTEALSNARFSLKIMILVLIMKLDARVPSNKIVSFLETIFGLKISDGEIYVMLNQLSRAYNREYEKLKEEIKNALAKNIDETGWSINGKNHWLWLFINSKAALYVPTKRRNHQTPQNVLGNQKDKTIIRDRWVSYDEFGKYSECNHQICWTHILRDSKKLAETHNEAKYVHKKMKYIYKMANKRASKKSLYHWIDLIASREYKSWNVYKFVKSICVKHKYNLFRFVYHPEIDSTNNRAERGLRHAVVIRKISNGSRSEDGANTMCKLLSVMQSTKLQTNNYYEGLFNLLQKTK